MQADHMLAFDRFYAVGWGGNAEDCLIATVIVSSSLIVFLQKPHLINREMAENLCYIIGFVGVEKEISTVVLLSCVI